ncbi:MAG TPA: hypothetical protein VHJ78_11715 [Actinomycetota bacterium]|nr:hypothetical protein [Actinomycetota bacterium]
MGDKPRLTAVGSGEARPPGSRVRSTVSFPYSDLVEAERAVRLVAESLGRCRPEQLAAWLGHSTLDSGAFRNKMAAAKLFGVLTGGRNEVTVTPLGGRLVEDPHVRQARVEAFLTVPLYRAIFDAHRGAKLPGSIGLELEMVRRGVSRTQVKAARRVFLRSADHAGFFEAGTSQLVLPRGTDLPAEASKTAGSPGQLANGRYPKIIEAVLEQAPWGSGWSEAEFEEWADLLVRAARVHFRLSADSGSGRS